MHNPKYRLHRDTSNMSFLPGQFKEGSGSETEEYGEFSGDEGRQSTRRRRSARRKFFQKPVSKSRIELKPNKGVPIAKESSSDTDSGSGSDNEQSKNTGRETVQQQEERRRFREEERAAREKETALVTEDETKRIDRARTDELLKAKEMMRRMESLGRIATDFKLPVKTTITPGQGSASESFGGFEEDAVPFGTTPGGPGGPDLPPAYSKVADEVLKDRDVTMGGDSKDSVPSASDLGIEIDVEKKEQLTELFKELGVNVKDKNVSDRMQKLPEDARKFVTKLIRKSNEDIQRAKKEAFDTAERLKKQALNIKTMGDSKDTVSNQLKEVLHDLKLRNDDIAILNQRIESERKSATKIQEAAIKAAVSGAITDLDIKLGEQKNILEIEQKKNVALEGQIETLKGSLETERQNVGNAENELTEAKRQITALDDAKRAAEAARARLEGEIDRVTKELELQKETAADIERGRLEAEKEVKRLRAEIEVLKVKTPQRPPSETKDNQQGATFAQVLKFAVNRVLNAPYNAPPKYPTQSENNPLADWDAIVKLLGQLTDPLNKDLKERDKEAAKMQGAIDKAVDDNRKLTKDLTETKADADRRIQASNRAKDDAIDEAKKSDATLRARITDLERELEREQKRLTPLSERIAKLEAELAATKSQLATAQNDKRVLEADLAAARDSKTSADRLLDEERKTLATARDAAVAAATQNAEMLRQKDQEIATLDSKLNRTANELKLATINVDGLTAALATQKSVKRDIKDKSGQMGEQFRQQYAQLEEQLRGAEDRNRTLKAFFDDLQAKYDRVYPQVRAAAIAYRLGTSTTWPNPDLPRSLKPPPYAFGPIAGVTISEWIVRVCSDKVFGDMLAESMGDFYAPWQTLAVQVFQFLSIAAEGKWKVGERGPTMVDCLRYILAAYMILVDRMNNDRNNNQSLNEPSADEMKKVVDPMWSYADKPTPENASEIIHAAMHAAVRRIQGFQRLLDANARKPALFPRKLGDQGTSMKPEQMQQILSVLSNPTKCTDSVAAIRRDPWVGLFWRYDAGSPLELILPIRHLLDENLRPKLLLPVAVEPVV